jgi:hypothetical protein
MCGGRKRQSEMQLGADLRGRFIASGGLCGLSDWSVVLSVEQTQALPKLFANPMPRMSPLQAGKELIDHKG